MDKQPCVSVIVPAHNGSHFLDSSLDALIAASYPSYEIIVVDDASTDDSVTISQKKGVSVLQLPCPLGPSAALNYGARPARGDILLMIDADVVDQKDTIVQVVDNFQEYPNLVCLSVTVLSFSILKSQIIYITVVVRVGRTSLHEGYVALL